MKVRYRQKQPYGCGLYSLANALNDPYYIKPELIEQTKIGGTIHHLNTLLDEKKEAIYIDTLFYNNYGVAEVPNGFTSTVPDTDNSVCILLIEYQNTIDSLRHIVPAFIYNNGSTVVIDSCREECIQTTVPDFCNGKIIYGIFCFCKIEDASWAVFYKEWVDNYLNSL